jgi:hypothetical protein
MAWAEVSLWVGQHRNRKIHQVDPDSGKILRTIDSNRFLTGVTWVGKELWHGTCEEEKSDLRRVDPQSGEVLELIEMPQGIGVSGLESNSADLFFCGGGTSGMVRAVRKPKRPRLFRLNASCSARYALRLRAVELNLLKDTNPPSPELEDLRPSCTKRTRSTTTGSYR